MQNISTTRILPAAGNDTGDHQAIIKLAYRGTYESPDTQIYRSQVRERAISYRISTEFMRVHCNPPVWSGLHPHNFIATIELVSITQPEDMYGVDMVEAENALKAIIDELPICVNDLIPSGTTEAIAQFILDRFSLPDPAIKIVWVGVGETPSRLTILYG